MPLFGSGLCSDLLAPVFVDAASVSDLNRQKNFRDRQFTRTAQPYADRLIQLQKPGMTVRLNRDVERLKIELSQRENSECQLDYIEPRLVAQATQEKLQQGAGSFMRSFWELLQQVSAGIQDERPMLFLTGGMSRAPYVVAAVKQVFPHCQVAPADASLGVVEGLAVYASLTEETLATGPA